MKISKNEFNKMLRATILKDRCNHTVAILSELRFKFPDISITYNILPLCQTSTSI